MTNDEIREYLEAYIQDEDELNNIVLFENPSYADALVGISHDNRLIYDYNKMVKFLVEHDKMEPDEAMEFIDYNTLRALPYMSAPGLRIPLIMMPTEDYI